MTPGPSLNLTSRTLRDIALLVAGGRARLGGRVRLGVAPGKWRLSASSKESVVCILDIHASPDRRRILPIRRAKFEGLASATERAVAVKAERRRTRPA